MAKVIALDTFTYQGLRTKGDIFEVSSDVHTKQLLAKGLAELYRADESKKKEPVSLSQVEPASVKTMSNVSGNGTKKKTTTKKKQST